MGPEAARKMSFEAAFHFVVNPEVEGGYVNDPQDPGGETKYGISKRAYPNEDIKNLTLDRAKELYLRDYWDKAGCDALAWPCALMVFDSAVNQGVSFAKTLHGTVDYMMADRAVRYTKSSIFEHDGRGWMRRLANVLIAGQKVSV